MSYARMGVDWWGRLEAARAADPTSTGEAVEAEIKAEIEKRAAWWGDHHAARTDLTPEQRAAAEELGHTERLCRHAALGAVVGAWQAAHGCYPVPED